MIMYLTDCRSRHALTFSKINIHVLPVQTIMHLFKEQNIVEEVPALRVLNLHEKGNTLQYGIVENRTFLREARHTVSLHGKFNMQGS